MSAIAAETESNGTTAAKPTKPRSPRRTRRNFAAELRDLLARVHMAKTLLRRITEDGDGATLPVQLAGVALETLDGE